MSRRVWRVLAEIEDLEPALRNKIVDRAFDHALVVHKAAFERVRQSYLDPKAPKNEQSLLATRLGICRTLLLSAKRQDANKLFTKIDAVRSYAREAVEMFQTADFPIKNELMRDVVRMTPREYGEPDNAFYMNLALYVSPRDQRDALLAESGLKRLVRTRTIDVTRWDAEPGAFDSAHKYRGIRTNATDVIESIETMEWNGNSIDGTGVQEAGIEKLLELVRKLLMRKPGN